MPPKTQRTKKKYSREPEGSPRLPGDTKERLLDAAEKLYAAGGIQGPSLRDITSEAGANLASVNYHFVSKDALTEAVFTRRLGPLNAERVRQLTEAEKAAGKKPPSLPTILHAVFDPVVELWEKYPDFIILLGRLQFEPDQHLHNLYLAQFEEVIDRFTATLTRALPHLPLKELWWRMHFVSAAMEATWTGGHQLEQISQGLCRVKPYQATVDRLIAFGVAGLKAPYRPEGKKS